MRLRLGLSLALIAMSLVPVGMAHTVSRCVGPDGRSVYSDRPCSEHGASNRLPTSTGTSQGYYSGYRGTRSMDCPRQIDELSYAVAIAIRHGDTNRLSTLYDWAGVPKSSFDRIYRRLEAITRNPLVDVVPRFQEYETIPAVPVVDDQPDLAADHTAAAGTTSIDASVNTNDGYDDPMPALPPPPRAVGLTLHQTSVSGNTPVTTQFQLHRRFNCLWIAF